MSTLEHAHDRLRQIGPLTGDDVCIAFKRFAEAMQAGDQLHPEIADMLTERARIANLPWPLKYFATRRLRSRVKAFHY